MKYSRILDRYNYLHPKFLYEDINDLKENENVVLRQKALPFEFPLNSNDKNDLLRLFAVFDSREKEGSLAAPQIGIPRRVIVFHVPMGRGVIQTFARTVFLNPTYDKIVDAMEESYEFCLSTSMVAPVMRYKRIHYKAYNVDGNLVEGEAQGVAARVIQHEIDHLDGVLITDLAKREQLITFEDYKARKKAAWGGKGWDESIPMIRKELEELRAYYPSLISKKKKKAKALQLMLQQENRPRKKKK